MGTGSAIVGAAVAVWMLVVVSLHGNYLLTGPQNRDSYSIFIVATSQHLPSEALSTDLSKCVLGEHLHNYAIITCT